MVQERHQFQHILIVIQIQKKFEKQRIYLQFKRKILKSLQKNFNLLGTLIRIKKPNNNISFTEYVQPVSQAQKLINRIIIIIIIIIILPISVISQSSTSTMPTGMYSFKPSELSVVKRTLTLSPAAVVGLRNLYLSM